MRISYTWINCFQLATLIAALKIEAETGLKVSRQPLLSNACELYGIKARTKKDAIPQLQAIYDEYMAQVESRES